MCYERCVHRVSESLHSQTKSPFVHTTHIMCIRIDYLTAVDSENDAKNLSSTLLTSSAQLSIDNCQGYSVSLALASVRCRLCTPRNILFVLFDDW